MALLQPKQVRLNAVRLTLLEEAQVRMPSFHRGRMAYSSACFLTGGGAE